MNLNDFRCMRNGLHLGLVSPKDILLLSGIDQDNTNKHSALLMLHGFASTPAVYRELLQACRHYDRVWAPPLPAHASDLAQFAGMKRETLFHFVENACRQLTEEYQHVDVMGISMGGLLACHLSACFPLRHLYLLAPALDIHLALNTCMTLTKILGKLGFQRVRNLAGNIHASLSCEIAYRQLPLSAVAEILKMIKRFRFVPPACSVDLFLGRHDAVAASCHVEARFKHHPQTRIHWLENSAHVLPLDGDVEVIRNCLENKSRAY